MGKSFDVLCDFRIDENAGCDFVSLNERMNELDGCHSALQIGGYQSCIEEIAFHRSSSIGGVGLLSWRIWSNVSSISSKSRSLHAPARASDFSVASFDTAWSA